MEIVKYLIASGADCNKPSNRKSPLMYAAKYDRLEIIQVLLETGADLHYKNERGRDAIDYARKYERKDAYILLKNDAKK